MRHWCTRIELPALLERALQVAMIGLAAVSLTPRPAFAQNPFSIEGTITATSNSGVTAVPANANPPCVITGGSTQACMIADPDGNRMEFQVDCGTVEQATELMRTDAFAANPVGVMYDPDALLARYQAGEDEAALLAVPAGAPSPIPAAHGMG